MSLVEWNERPPEEANLFNPAFLGMLATEFVKEFQKAKDTSCPITLPFCGLPVALHSKTRDLLPSSTITSLYTWRERNPKVLIGYSDRVKSLRPFIQESIRFCLDRNALNVTEAGELEIGQTNLTTGKKFENGLTLDARDNLASTRMIARWFAKAGTESTILACWGIKP